MIITPKTKGFICTTAHPTGCEASVAQQIGYVTAQKPLRPIKNALIIGSSMGYGLASRIAAAFGAGAATLGVSYDKNAAGGRTATAGYYNTAAFHKFAGEAGLKARSIVGDAFSTAVKEQTIELLKAEFGPVDLFIYSLAAPSRIDRFTGERFSSVLKPVGQPYSNRSIDMSTGALTNVTLQPATQAEIDATIQVMGGGDWSDWVELLSSNDLLADGALTLAYSYIGPELTFPIYRDGSIGQAKNHLKATADAMNSAKPKLKALISVNKAVVTQASSAIPVVPLYISILFDIMKKQGSHEDCIQQMHRMLQRLETPNPTDAEGFVRMDDWEMAPEVQAEVSRRWRDINEDNLTELADVPAYREDFLKLFGFDIAGVDYAADVSELASDDGFVAV